MNGSISSRVFDLLLGRRALVLVGVALGVLAGLLGALQLRIDMSFRPTFIGDKTELARTAEHERVFGQVGFRDLVAIAAVRDAADPQALLRVAELGERLRALPEVSEVRDALHFPFFNRSGVPQPLGLAGPVGAGLSLSSPEARPLIEDLLRAPAARRLVVGDGNRVLAVTASLAIPNEDFARRRDAVAAFRRVVGDWSKESGIATQVTGYPEVEQIYAEEVLSSVLCSIGVLLVMMVLILGIYFRRVTDVVTCLAGVTLSVPVVLGLMTLFGQPFSIVNSQVLTLVLIVGIGQALHHQEEYRRRREAGRDHTTANREAFSILAWPSFMTGLATTAGFAALVTADMKAIWSFGLSTAVGVVVVYIANWLVVPHLIQHFYRSAPPTAFFRAERSWTLSIVRRADALLQRRPGLTVLGFVLVTLVLGVAGFSGLSVDQKVNEELPVGHPALLAETSYEQQLAGFLGPELSIRPQSKDLRGVTDELVTFVNRLCDMPEVRYVASPLDFLPQSPGEASKLGKACHRQGGDLTAAFAARNGAAGPALQALSSGLLSSAGDQGAVVVRVADIGTAKSLPFVNRVRELARQSMPHAVVRPVGQWWLAQQGMNRLSFDVMLSAVTALLVILPIMWAAIRDRKLFLAAIPPTVLPVLATLGFMGLTHITVRIGTAMILAIALGLSADDTVHLSVRIRDRIRAGSEPASAVRATLLRTGRPCSFSSYVLIFGFASIMASSLLALRAMGLIAMFTMTFALAADLVLGPAIYLLLSRKRESGVETDQRRASLQSMLSRTVQLHPEQPAVTYRLSASEVRTLTWHELTHIVLEVAAKLDAVVGAARSVAILSATDARYPVLELALGLTGRSVQPLYVESRDEELRHALATTRAEVLVVGASEVERAQSGRLHGRIIQLEALVRLPGLAGAPHAALPAEVEPFDTRAVRARLGELTAREAGTPLLRLQSTGTTGPARVIELSEAALVDAVRAIQGEASHAFPRCLSFLPTAHISERFLTLYASIALAGHTWYGGGLTTLAADLRACRPTLLLAPPILLSAIQANAVATASLTRLGGLLLESVQQTTDALLASGVVGGARRRLGACLFGRELRRQAGLDQVRDAISGTAPLAAPLQAWFEAVGLPLRVVYGQTELAGATSITAARGATFGAVGRPLAGVELRLAPSGELLVKASAVFTRYVGDAVATSRTLEGGWLHTGDRAKLLASGELVLLGRLQSLVVAPDGVVVDTARIAEQVEAAFGPADLAISRRFGDPGVQLYVAVRALSSNGPRALSERDPRWSELAALLERHDPHRVVQGFALFDGAFEQTTGEVGPTGKPRAWRIHERRADALRLRDIDAAASSATRAAG